MTFIASSQTFGDLLRPLVAARRPPRMPISIRIGDEEGARKALGADGHLPLPHHPGRSLEDLARIALG